MPRPFDSDRLSDLLKGLEASIVTARKLSDDNPNLRLDSQFQARTALCAISVVKAHEHERIGDLAGRSLKGRNIPYSEEGSFPVVRSGDISDFFNPDALLRSSNITDAFFVKEHDILISSIGQGSIGKVQIFRQVGKYATVSEVTVIRQEKYKSAYVAAFLASSYGQAQIERFITGATGQLHLYPANVDRIILPVFDSQFQERVEKIYDRIWQNYHTARLLQKKAQHTLLAALGLADWTPPEPLSYTARVSDALAAGRMDARFFAPRIQALLDILSRDGRIVSDLAAPRRQKFQRGDCDTFHYIEISDIDGAGAAGSTLLTCADAPSRATWHVRSNDIITSTVRPIRRLSAQIAPEQDGYVCSSGFVVIRPRSIPSELLLTYLRLPVICELLDLYASASMYPAITNAHIFGLPIPEIGLEVEAQVVASMRDAKAAKVQSTKLFEAAKRAVEIAIEDGEAAATAFLDTLGRSMA